MYFTEDELSLYALEQRTELRRHWLKNYSTNMERFHSDHTVLELPDLRFCKPVVVIGAAPIRPEVLEMLSGIRGLMSVCCDKALPRVLEHLRPRFVTALNTVYNETVRLDEWFKDAPPETGLIVPLTVHPRTAELWPGPVYWMTPDNIDEDLVLRFEQETGVSRWHRGLNVGEFSVSMGAFMRPAELDLFGMWYAWKTREEVLDQYDDMENYDVVEVVNGGERWWSTLAWMQSRTGLLTFCKKLYIQGIEIFNNSEGGVLYHADYCKPQTPGEFERKWADTLSLSEVRVHDAPDAGDGGD